MFAVTVAFLEVAAYLWFYHGMPVDMRDSALFTVNDQSKELPKELIPAIQPYIWANYMPNPDSPQANKYGWRYGGGPKQSGTFRILCLGGSTTWSQAVTAPEFSYPARLESYLRGKGYNVDVVNGGVPYFTTAEMVGTLAFRGIYTSPDLILIHEGGNDAFPLQTPNGYKPDYTHWRVVDPAMSNPSSEDYFRMLWRIPSWTSRVFLTYRLHPNALNRQMVGKQLTTAQESLLATNDISQREPEGLKNNLRTLISIARGHGANVATITFNMRHEKLVQLVPQMANNPQLSERVIKRSKLAVDKSNDAIRSVSASMSVPTIPFDKFETTRPEYWVDQCHLSNEGANEKATFIGEYLLKYKLIPEQYQKKE